MKSELRVERLGQDDIDTAVSVLAEAFFDYPVMRFVLGESGDYRADLSKMLRFFVMARILRDEWLLGARSSGELLGVALLSFPSRQKELPQLRALGDAMWEEIGAGARGRYELYGQALARFDITNPHLHLNTIGVRGPGQGKGVGRALMDFVHEISADDVESSGVSLTTELQSNVALYEHFGYQIIGQTVVGEAFDSWFMYRRDPDSTLPA